jgi:DNA-binding NarL/FixJ family response regulator
VKAHVSHALTKLDLANRTQIALLVHDAGLD